MKNQKGFSLIEVMITTGIMSTVALVSMQLMYNSMLANQTNTVKNDVNTLVAQVSQTVMDNQSCTNAITKLAQPLGATLRFDMPDGTAITQGQALSKIGVTVTSFATTNSTLISSIADGTAIRYGTLQLNLTATKKILGSQQFAPRSVGATYFLTAPNGTVLQCGGSLSTLQTVLSTLQATADAAKAAAAAATQAASTVVPVTGCPAEFALKCVADGGSIVNGGCVYPVKTTDTGCDKK